MGMASLISNIIGTYRTTTAENNVVKLVGKASCLLEYWVLRVENQKADRTQ